MDYNTPHFKGKLGNCFVKVGVEGQVRYPLQMSRGIN